jgi:hypothetical protein
MKMDQSVPKLWYIKFRRRGNTQKKAYSIHNKANVWNKKLCIYIAIETQRWCLTWKFCSKYRGADKSLARPTSRCILFDGKNNNKFGQITGIQE